MQTSKDQKLSMATLRFFHFTVKRQKKGAKENLKRIQLEAAVSYYKWLKLGEGGNVNVLISVHRRAQLRHCLEQLKQQVPLSSDSSRNTTLSLLRRAQMHIKKLQEQNERAELLKDRLRWEQQELRMRLQQLQSGTERMRNDSLGSAMSSERSDSDREDVEIDVESMVWTLDPDGLGLTHTDADHSYSTSDRSWL
ncbi:hypothetical protein QTP70_016847 [Hemibagrus guttatus]|uniref:Max dimerization protein 3 n=1 Tax=Hemibagrus guttatus TaxID=175788 RepID=A0AAE0V596_9TELE|nr:hypothetical protein QTP70_016847 [Hemibagrus guttatus]